MRAFPKRDSFEAGRVLAGLPVAREAPVIPARKFVINCHDPPAEMPGSLPNGLRVKEHRQFGKLEWCPQKVQLYRSEGQQGDSFVYGHELYKELADKPVLTVNVLDFLLAHPDLIPEEWKGLKVFFWGTIYQNQVGRLGVPFLCFYEGSWRSGFYWVDSYWIKKEPAAMIAVT